MKLLGKILPKEGYYVLIDGNPPTDYAISLTHLYQPLIGMEAITLYQTLLHEINIQPQNSLQTHHTLMNYLNLPLDEIYDARLKLEGIGLLKTYESKQGIEKTYTYVLQRPFSTNDFFNDAMLSELLYHHIGEQKYKNLKKHFQQTNTNTLGNNITASFSEVFQTFQPNFDHQQPLQNKQDEQFRETNYIDFSWMEVMLQQRMINVETVLTLENKKLISDLMFLYDLTTYEVEKSVLWALTEENKLDREEFKLACHDIFKSKNHHKPIKLVAKKSTNIKRNPEDIPQTKEDQLVHRLETISPKQLLEDLSSGNQASEQDMKIIREVMTSQGLPSSVMNVLIHYVLLQSNMKLSKAYMEKIASHWSRANLKTAREAMDFAKKEIERFQQNAKKRSTYTYRKPVSNEVIPEWFKDRKKKQSNKSKQTNNTQTEQERNELAALIRQFAEE